MAKIREHLIMERFSCRNWFFWGAGGVSALSWEVWGIVAWICLGPVRTTPEEFDNGGFTLKTHQMFSVHTTLGKFKSATITGYFGFLFEETSDKEITWITELHRFWKAPFSKRFPSKRKCKVGVFKFLRRAERFGKALFSRRISVDGRPNSRNQAAFSNSFGVV